MPKAGSAALSSTLSASLAGTAIDLHLVPPIAFGLLGVFLSRLVFVDRENRRLHKRQTLRDTLPLTMVAMLVAGALIGQYDLNLPKAIFAGLGIGWVAVLLLDVIGERILAFIGGSSVKITDMKSLGETPTDMDDLTRMIDRVTEQGEPK